MVSGLMDGSISFLASPFLDSSPASSEDSSNYNPSSSPNFDCRSEVPWSEYDEESELEEESSSESEV